MDVYINKTTGVPVFLQSEAKMTHPNDESGELVDCVVLSTGDNIPIVLSAAYFGSKYIKLNSSGPIKLVVQSTRKPFDIERDPRCTNNIMD